MLKNQLEKLNLSSDNQEAARSTESKAEALQQLEVLEWKPIEHLQ